MNTATNTVPGETIDFARFRTSTAPVLREAEAARAEYLAGVFATFGRRTGEYFRGMSDVFTFARQANEAARL